MKLNELPVFAHNSTCYDNNFVMCGSTNDLKNHQICFQSQGKISLKSKFLRNYRLSFRISFNFMGLLLEKIERFFEDFES